MGGNLKRTETGTKFHMNETKRRENITRRRQNLEKTPREGERTWRKHRKETKPGENLTRRREQETTQTEKSLVDEEPGVLCQSITGRKKHITRTAF